MRLLKQFAYVQYAVTQKVGYGVKHRSRPGKYTRR